VNNFSNVFLYPTILLLLISNKVFANVDIQWNLQGDDLHYVITAASHPDNASKNISCGLLGGSCFVQMGFGSVPWSGVIWKDSVNLRGNQTPAAVTKAWSNSYIPRSGVISNWSTNSSKCLNLYAYSSIAGGSFIGNSCDGSLTPPPPPKPNVTCSIIGPINLNHGPLAQGKANGNYVTQPVNIVCSGKASVLIQAISDNNTNIVNLDSSGSLSSSLTVNNINGKVGATVSVPGPTGIYVNITSTINSSGDEKLGVFSGSGLAILTIQ